MRSLTIIILLLFCFQVECQVTPVNFNECEIGQMFVTADTEPVWQCDTIGLIEYMNKSVLDKNLEQVSEGRIIIGILIYENGKTCCHSFFNMTKTALDPEIYKEAINKMPDWSPGKQNNKEITYLKQQLFNIKEGKFVEN